MNSFATTVLFLVLQIVSASHAEQKLLSSEFIWDFFKAAFNERQNAALSPFTTHLGMSLLTPIVSDRYTLHQMLEKLHLPPRNLVKLPDLYQRKLAALRSDGRLRYGTKLYAFGDGQLNPAFISSVYSFNASLERRPWLNVSRVVQAANEWAYRSTLGAVKNLLSAKDLLPDTRLVMLNAVAFAAEWEQAFSFNRSRKEMFNAYSIGKLFMVEFMEQHQVLLPMAFDDSMKMTAVEVPFRKGSDYSMLVLLPTERDANMTAAINALNAESFEKLYDSLVPRRVTVRLPRFQIATTVNVKDVLEKLQLSAPFKWSVFQVFQNEKLMLDKMKMSAVVEVGEKGVRAAAASASTMMIRSAPLTFVADRPFLYVILKQSIRYPIFVGNYAFPAQSKPIKP